MRPVLSRNGPRVTPVAVTTFGLYSSSIWNAPRFVTLSIATWVTKAPPGGAVLKVGRMQSAVPAAWPQSAGAGVAVGPTGVAVGVAPATVGVAVGVGEGVIVPGVDVGSGVPLHDVGPVTVTLPSCARFLITAPSGSPRPVLVRLKALVSAQDVAKVNVRSRPLPVGPGPSPNVPQAKRTVAMGSPVSSSSPTPRSGGKHRGVRSPLPRNSSSLEMESKLSTAGSYFISIS